jgi:hypothetical protein
VIKAVRRSFSRYAAAKIKALALRFIKGDISINIYKRHYENSKIQKGFLFRYGIGRVECRKSRPPKAERRAGSPTWTARHGSVRRHLRRLGQADGDQQHLRLPPGIHRA